MKKISGFLIIIFLIGTLVHESSAQIKRRKIKRNNKRMSNYKGHRNSFGKSKRYNYVGISLNSFNYFGDLSPLPGKFSTDIGFTRPAIGLTFGHRFGPRYTLRAELRYGTLRGNDFESAEQNDENAKFRYVRNLSFRNRIKELTVTAMFDLLPNGSTHINRVKATPYAFIGLTLFHHNPQAKVGADGPESKGEWVDLQPLGTEGQNLDLRKDHPNSGVKRYSKFQLAIPFGIGGRFRLNEVLDLSFEMAVRYTFTDYLDDVSGNYVSVDKFPAGSLARYMSDRSREKVDAESGTARNEKVVNAITGGKLGIEQPPYRGYGGPFHSTNIRGNSKDNDFYFVTTLRVCYILGGSFRKAKFR